jgi:hypothetical protein
VENDAGNEAITEMIAQPGQVAGVLGGRGRRPLDLKSDYASAAQLGQEIDLLTAIRGPEVSRRRPAGSSSCSRSCISRR